MTHLCPTMVAADVPGCADALAIAARSRNGRGLGSSPRAGTQSKAVTGTLNSRQSDETQKAQASLRDQASDRRTAVARVSFYRPAHDIGCPSGSRASALTGFVGSRASAETEMSTREGQAEIEIEAEAETELWPGTPVEVDRASGTTLGLVREWRVDGIWADANQERLVVETNNDGETAEIDVTRSAVAVVDGSEAHLVREVVGDE